VCAIQTHLETECISCKRHTLYKNDERSVKTTRAVVFVYFNCCRKQRSADWHTQHSIHQFYLTCINQAINSNRTWVLICQDRTRRGTRQKHHYVIYTKVTRLLASPGYIEVGRQNLENLTGKSPNGVQGQSPDGGVGAKLHKLNCNIIFVAENSMTDVLFGTMQLNNSLLYRLQYVVTQRRTSIPEDLASLSPLPPPLYCVYQSRHIYSNLGTQFW